MDRDKLSSLYRGPSIDASYPVSVHFAKRFQRRRILKISQSETRVTVAAMLVNGSGRNEQSLQRTFHRCFLPSFGSFGQAVSEEKIFKNLYRDKCILNTDIYIQTRVIFLLTVDILEINQSETRIACGGHVC
jgi:hypothetical protein